MKVPVINSLNDLVVIPEEVELLLDSSFSPLEIVVRLKQEISKMYKHFFFFFSIQKVKYYWLGEPYIYHDLGVIYKEVGILLGRILSDCYYTNFGDSLVIVKLQPVTFNCSLLMSHLQ